jgi:hypothetical protein
MNFPQEEFAAAGTGNRSEIPNFAQIRFSDLTIIPES